MGVGGNMDRAREAVRTVLAHMQAKGDEAALYTFDSKLQEVVSFTTDLARIRELSLAGRPWGTTSLYDSIAAGPRAAKRAWLIEHDYRVMEARAADVTNDVAGVLEKLAAAIPATT